jgi:ubiquinone/menaquinone biosynthesis C-methylase UbiE
VARFAALLLLPALASCSQTPSVAPGINDPYRDADPAQWVERFEREGREIYDRRGEIVAAIGLGPGHDVADVGAGTGLFTPLLAEAVGPQGTVYAVDIVPEFVEHVRARAAALGLENVRPVLCSERSVELPPASLDRAFLCDTYHHLEYPAATMASLRRALRPGGEMLVVDFERNPGESSDWILEHVRAGREVVRGEIEAAGFRHLETIDMLEENWVMRFARE